MGSKINGLRKGAYLCLIVVFFVLIGCGGFVLYKNQDISMSEHHYMKLAHVATYFEPYCGEEYKVRFKDLSEDGLSSIDVLDLLGISRKTYLYHQEKDDFLINRLNCVGWNGGPFDHAGRLSELTNEINQGMYKQVDKRVDGSVELKQMLESMLDKGYLSTLDFYLIETHYSNH